MEFTQSETGFTLKHKGHTVLNHSFDEPILFLGKGKATYDMYRGNFDIKDFVAERIAMRRFTADETDGTLSIQFFFEGNPCITFMAQETPQGRLKISFTSTREEFNRFWLRLAAHADEKIYGCGEQLTYLNLRGHNFPLWTSEPGVGRNKSTYVTWQADIKDRAGGDYYNTNYPQPTFVSSDKYFAHLETTAYADFDFRDESFHELQAWAIPDYLLFDIEDSFPALMSNFMGEFGTQPELPEWVYDGVILGIQGGTDLTLEKVHKARAAGVKVNAVWCQDWQGVKYTSFGKRLLWNWQWNPEVYPELDTRIHEMKRDGIRFLGYINPYVLEDYPLYKEAEKNGYLATKEDGSKYVVDFGEFYCGVVDFTRQEACEWFKQVIKKEMIDFGLDGWMADFGEYLPTDCKLASNLSSELEHNNWPARWAKINHDAIEEAGKTDDILFFMRAGFTGTARYCHVLWAGDQCVNWNIDDGIPSVINAALSSGLMGNGIHHSDIGGYTTLHGMHRDKELFMRWSEMAAFTPIMRTHEGNRPDDNHQFDTDMETLAHLARMTRIFTHLKSYIMAAVKENHLVGMPVQRPLFMHYDEEPESYQVMYEYLLGRDCLVAPVYEQGATKRKLYLPPDRWIHIWSGEHYDGGWVEVDAPIGKPAVFYRSASADAVMFGKLPDIADDLD
nr:alpha-glucosidase [uncultured Cohaesibacter sp.]